MELTTAGETWFTDDLDQRDPLNRTIWAESVSLGATLPGAPPGATAGALQDRDLDGRGPLPWVPDLVGSRWHDSGRVLVVGSTYADFFTPAATRTKRITLSAYRRAATIEAFQNLFLHAVVRGDASYYERIGALLNGFTTPDRVTLTDLCRGTFARFDGSVEPGDPSVRSALRQFREYVDATNDWTRQRIDECAAGVIVALGDLAGQELVRLLVEGSRYRLVGPGGAPYGDGRSYRRSATGQRDWFWAVRDGSMRRIVVASHPSNQNRNDPAYRNSRAAVRAALAAGAP